MAPAASARTDRSTSGSATSRPIALNWWRAALFGAVTATVLNLVIWGAVQIAGVSLVLWDPGSDYVVQASSVAASSAVPMVVGIVLASVIARWRPGVIRMAQVLGALMAVGTLWGVFAYGMDATTITALTLMHFVSGVVVVFAPEGLRRHVPAGKRPS